MKMNRLALLVLVALAAASCAAVAEDRHAPHPKFASIPQTGEIGDERDMDTRSN